MSRVPFLYGLFAHGLFAVALALVAWEPTSIAGFFYHPRMIAVVHTLTLGWLSSSLIADSYREGSIGRLDRIGVVLWAATASGLPSHFWIEEFGGMAWSAGALVILATAFSLRGLALLATSERPWIPRMIESFAWINFLATAAIGLVIGLNRTHSILPGYSLHHAFGHAHLAAAGWVGLMLLARRLRNQRGDLWLAASVIALQLGILGCFVVLFSGEGSLLPVGILSLGGWISIAVWMLVRWRSLAVLPVSLAALLTAAVAIHLLASGDATAIPHWLLIYGVCGLLWTLGGAVANGWTATLPDSLAARLFRSWWLWATLLGVGLVSDRLLVLRVGAAGLALASAAGFAATLAWMRVSRRV